MDSYVFFAPNAFQISLNTANMTVFGGLRAPTIHHQQCTEKCFPTEVFSHRGFHAKKFLHTEALTHRCFTQRCFAQRSIADALYTQRLLRTDALTHTQKLLHRETCAQTASTRRSFLSPPKKSGKQVFELGSFSFPVVSLPDNEC